MEEWKVGRKEECGNSTIRPPIAIGATMEEWKVGVKPTRFAKPVRFFEGVNGRLEGWKNGIMWQFDNSIIR